MVKYHVKTSEQGVVTRTSQRQLEPGRYRFLVTYESYWSDFRGENITPRPTFHFTMEAAQTAIRTRIGGSGWVKEITTDDYTVS